MKRLVLLILLLVPVIARPDTAPFHTGERVEYAILAAGFRVGTQTIEFMSDPGCGGYLLRGSSRTTPFMSLFYKLDDKWFVSLDRETLLPDTIEKHVTEGERVARLLYRVDRAGGKVMLENADTGEGRTIAFEHDVFDLFSVIYHLRYYPRLLEGGFTFDFLEEKRVKTVILEDTGESRVSIPSLMGGAPVPVQRLVVENEGIEIFISRDNLRLPLKLTVKALLPGNKTTLIEFLIRGYDPGDHGGTIPPVYREIMTADPS